MISTTFENPMDVVSEAKQRISTHIQEISGRTLFGRISNNIPENDVGVCRNITTDLPTDIGVQKNMKTYTLVDIQNYLVSVHKEYVEGSSHVSPYLLSYRPDSSLHISIDNVRDVFRHFLTDNVYIRIHDLDKIVVEISPPSVPTTSSTTIHHHSSYTNGGHSIGTGGTGGTGGSKYHHDRTNSSMVKKNHYSDHKGRRIQSSMNVNGRAVDSHQLDHSQTKPSKYASISGDWNAGKTFKPTKILTKEGIEKDINDIRMSLNKISNKNYETHRDLILALVENLIPDVLQTEDDDMDVVVGVQNINDMVRSATRNVSHQQLTTESTFGAHSSLAVTNLQRVAQFIFDIASTNKFYGEIYADLYKELVLKFEIFKTILLEFVSTYNETIKTIQYVDSNVDYDAYCDYTKNNDKRRATAAFLILLMNRSVLDITTMVTLILHFQTIFTEYIHLENRTNEVDEITEVLFILIPIGKEILSTLPEWNEHILPNLMAASKLKAKDLRSLSSRSVFKYMDLLKKIA